MEDEACEKLEEFFDEDGDLLIKASHKTKKQGDEE